MRRQLLVQGLLDNAAALRLRLWLGVALEDSLDGHSVGQRMALEWPGRLVLLVQTQHLPAGYVGVQQRLGVTSGEQIRGQIWLRWPEGLRVAGCVPRRWPSRRNADKAGRIGQRNAGGGRIIALAHRGIGELLGLRQQQRQRHRAAMGTEAGTQRRRWQVVLLLLLQESVGRSQRTWYGSGYGAWQHCGGGSWQRIAIQILHAI